MKLSFAVQQMTLVKRSRDLWASKQLHSLQIQNKTTFWSHVNYSRQLIVVRMSDWGDFIYSMSGINYFYSILLFDRLLHQNGGFYTILIRQIPPIIQNAVPPPLLLRL